MNLWNRLKVLKLFLQLVQDPNRTDLIFKGVAIFSKNPDVPPIKAIESLILSDEIFKIMHQENYIPQAPALEDLAKLPENSFGYAVYQHMNTNGLGFETFPVLPSRRPIHYMSTRIYQDHDLWHTLLGYGITVEDELAIQAFSVAQFRSPISTMLIAGGLLHLLGKNPLRAVDGLHKVVEGYNTGKKSKFLLSVRLHELFPKPLTEVRQVCGIAAN
jgi:ubiquinone biosynthesis protein COQ4